MLQVEIAFFFFFQGNCFRARELMHFKLLGSFTHRG